MRLPSGEGATLEVVATLILARYSAEGEFAVSCPHNVQALEFGGWLNA